MDQKTAENLLKKVKEDYNLTAKEFSDTRFKAWNEFKIFKKYVKNSDRVLDLGCGNGRLYDLFKNKQIDYIGVDNSESLINFAQRKHPKAKFILSDVLNLPFFDHEFDVVISVAMLHHIPSEELRIKAFKEIKRVLKKDGMVIITVWNLRQLKLIFKYKLWHLIFGSRIQKLDKGDTFIPWKAKKGKTIKRYYHAFTLRELTRIVKKSGFKILKKIKGNNLVIIAKNVKI